MSEQPFQSPYRRSKRDQATEMASAAVWVVTLAILAAGLAVTIAPGVMAVIARLPSVGCS